MTGTARLDGAPSLLVGVITHAWSVGANQSSKRVINLLAASTTMVGGNDHRSLGFPAELLRELVDVLQR